MVGECVWESSWEGNMEAERSLKMGIMDWFKVDHASSLNFPGLERVSLLVKCKTMTEKQFK